MNKICKEDFAESLNVMMRFPIEKPVSQKGVNNIKQLLALGLLLFSFSTIAVDIHGDFTVGLGGIPASFDDSINEGETKDGSSFINNFYRRDGFMGQAQLVNGNGIYPNILSTEGSVTNGCTLTVQNWIDYTPHGK